mmetsp:Transcript_2613/g.10051  ORF Transcript_2613/g.10051 Transcript_2613/m.10051 type:complete len:279 (-) Transcript_2613:331-1167(-)
MGLLAAFAAATWAFGKSVDVNTHWAITEEAIARTLSTFGAVTVADYAGGPTRVRSRCTAYFDEACAAADAVARGEDMEIAGRKCRVTLRRLAREDRKHGLSPHRKATLVATLDAAADVRGPRPLPERLDNKLPAPSRGTVVAALEALDEASALDDAEAFAVAVAALARVGETQRALALYAQLDSRRIGPSPAVHGAAVYALCAAHQSRAALELLRSVDGDVDARGYNAAIAAAEKLGDFDLAYELLQRRAKLVNRAEARLAFQRDALNAKRRWLEKNS